MLMRFFRKIRGAVTLLKIGAFKVFLAQLRRQIYSRYKQIGFIRSLDYDYVKNSIDWQMEYRLREASKEDMKEAFKMIKTESQESAQMLLHRQWLYECNCGKWFVARTADTDELCFLQCIISPEDNSVLDRGFRNWFPRLKKGELITEAAYTFEKFRGHHIPGPIMRDILNMYRDKGFKQMIIYIDEDKEYLINKSEERGFTRFEEVSFTKILFFNKRKSKSY